MGQFIEKCKENFFHFSLSLVVEWTWTFIESSPLRDGSDHKLSVDCIKDKGYRICVYRLQMLEQTMYNYSE